MLTVAKFLDLVLVDPCRRSPRLEFGDLRMRDVL
jgi:hypothetical protein